MNVITMHLPSPPQFEMRGRNKPTRIVVHAMAEKILDPHAIDAVDFLRNYNLSAHALCYPSGTIVRCREDHEFAWHARGANTNTLGIEFLVKGEHDYASFVEAIKKPDWLTSEQYESGQRQLEEWIERHEIKDIVRHSDISTGRKVDPGDGFPWRDFLHDLGMD